MARQSHSGEQSVEYAVRARAEHIAEQHAARNAGYYYGQVKQHSENRYTLYFAVCRNGKHVAEQEIERNGYERVYKRVCKHRGRFGVVLKHHYEIVEPDKLHGAKAVVLVKAVHERLHRRVVVEHRHAYEHGRRTKKSREPAFEFPLIE